MKRAVVSLLIIVISVFGCKKKGEVVGPNTSVISGSYSPLSSLFDANFENRIQTFEIDPSIKNIVEGKNGMFVCFHENSFVDDNGELVTSTVKIELVELLDYHDMLATNKTTSSAGKVLVSGGQASLKAFINGKPIKSTKSVLITSPITNYDIKFINDMSFFLGEEVNGDINWNENIGLNQSVNNSLQRGITANNPLLMYTNPDTIINGQDTIIEYNYLTNPPLYFYFSFNNPNLGWINFDYFYESNTTNIDLYLEEKFNCNNTKSFLVFPSINSVVSYDCNYAFNEDLLPIGLDVIIVSISEIEGQYYSSFRNTTIQNNHVEHIVMNPTTLNDINKRISNL